MEPQTHSLSTRFTHWLNAVVVFSMLATGFALFSQDRHFASIAHLVPAWIWAPLHHLGTRRQLFSWHIDAAALLTLNGLAFLVWRLKRGSWRRITWDASYHREQRWAYTAVLTMGAVMILTGAALWLKHPLPWLIAAIGGERIVLPVHIVLATSLLAFIAMHVVQVARAGLPTLRSMTTGSHARFKKLGITGAGARTAHAVATVQAEPLARRAR